jgi:hypothetical protein
MTIVLKRPLIRRINELPLRKSAGVVAQAAEERCRLPLEESFSKRHTSAFCGDDPRILTRFDGAPSLGVIITHGLVRR